AVEILDDGAVLFKNNTKYIAKRNPDGSLYGLKNENIADDIVYSGDIDIPASDKLDIDIDDDFWDDLADYAGDGDYGGLVNAGDLLTKRTNWLNNLKSQFNFNNAFIPQGLNPNIISETLKKQIIEGFSSALPSSLKENLFNTLIRSGFTVPTRKTLSAGEELYKIVPKGSGYTKSSFYMSKSEYNTLKNSLDIEQKLGLPLGSHAIEYDVYKATAMQNVDVFESVVAKTVQGGYTTTGGAKQTFLLDDSKWSITLEPNSLIPSK
ncbi:MAG: hypothetical protein ACK5IQ_06070, partial [Bacteroidales bacterium]